MKFKILFILFFLICASSKRSDDTCDCGKDKNGETAKHQWHALLYVRASDGFDIPYCNGVLISPWHVLTVYTCVFIGKHTKCSKNQMTHFYFTFLSGAERCIRTCSCPDWRQVSGNS